MNNTDRTLDLEPNWAGLRRWALAGLRATPNEKALKMVLAECEKAKAAGRPDTDWEDES